MGNKNTVFENYSKSLIFKNIFALRATSQVTEPLSGIISLCETLEARPLHFHEKFSAIFDPAPSVSCFFLLSVLKLEQFLTSLSLKNADVLNG